MVIRPNKSINQLHLWYTRLFKRGSKVNVTMTPVASSQVVRSSVCDDDVDADERERRRDGGKHEYRRGRRRVDARENAVIGT